MTSEEKMKAEPINVWSVKRYFMMYSKFPQMTENGVWAY